MSTWRWIGCAAIAACGGTTVVEPQGGGGSGATSSGEGGSGATTSSSSASSTGTMPTTMCKDHQDCPGGICVFSSGFCAAACGGEFCEDCGPGLVCDGCATSSCPVCADCKPACVPPHFNMCDDSDGCPARQACNFQTGTCMPLCSADGLCADPNLVCEECATGSCCGCKDCVGLCMPLDAGG